VSWTQGTDLPPNLWWTLTSEGGADQIRRQKRSPALGCDRAWGAVASLQETRLERPKFQTPQKSPHIYQDSSHRICSGREIPNGRSESGCSAKFKYLAAVTVALSLPGFGLVAFSFLAFCDRGAFLVCFLRMVVVLGVALAQLVGLVGRPA
jgi:hypothetical protein